MASVDTALLLLCGNLKTSDHGLRSALQSTTKRLYVYFAELAGPIDVELLNILSRTYDVTAIEAPVLDVVPLLPIAGWTAENVAALPGVEAILFSGHGDANNGERAAEQLRSSWPVESRRPALRRLDSSGSGPAGDDEAASSVELQARSTDFPVPKVALGGTFDRLHAGHRMLLAVAAAVSSHVVYVGVTGEQLLANKKYKELLQSYEHREAAVREFLKAVRPSLVVATGPLLDPKKRTEAAIDPEMAALVLSKETLPGGLAINKDRREQGFQDLTLVVVNLLGQDSKGLGGQKLSSTALREKEARGR